MVRDVLGLNSTQRTGVALTTIRRWRVSWPVSGPGGLFVGGCGCGVRVHPQARAFLAGGGCVPLSCSRIQSTACSMPSTTTWAPLVSSPSL